MEKKLLQSLLFILTFCLIFGLLTPVFTPKDNSEDAGIHDEKAEGFLAEPENTIDVLFLGNSEAYSAFSPLVLWEQYGIPSYCVSQAAQPIYQGYAHARRVFETQNPKYVILEPHTFYQEDGMNLARLLGYLLEERLPLLRYHDRWKHLTPEDWREPVRYQTIQRDKGYRYMPQAEPADTTGYMAYSEIAEPVPLISRYYAGELLTLCQEHDAQLILVSTPSTMNWSYFYHNGVDQLAKELGVPYIDMNLMRQEVPVDWSADSYDAGNHLNYSGAQKVSSWMGTYLWNTGMFTDKREDPLYAPWNVCVEQFHESMQ